MYIRNIPPKHTMYNQMKIPLVLRMAVVSSRLEFCRRSDPQLSDSVGHFFCTQQALSPDQARNGHNTPDVLPSSFVKELGAPNRSLLS